MLKIALKHPRSGEFPINRRHQGLATATLLQQQAAELAFPINRRHQRLATLLF